MSQPITHLATLSFDTLMQNYMRTQRLLVARRALHEKTGCQACQIQAYEKYCTDLWAEAEKRLEHVPVVDLIECADGKITFTLP